MSGVRVGWRARCPPLSAQGGEQFEFGGPLAAGWRSQDQQGLRLVFGEQDLAVHLDGAQLGVHQRLVVGEPLSYLLARPQPSELFTCLL